MSPKIVDDPLAEFRAGSLEPWAVSVLQAFVRLRRPRRILELGTFQARTTMALAKTAPDAFIMTVDHEKRFRGGLPNNIAFKKSDAIAFLKGCGRDVFDFVFVDDDHTRSHVEEEVDLLMDGIVSEGGLIVLHDVIGPFGLDEVVTSRGGFVVELPLLHAGGGLGVLEVGG